MSLTRDELRETAEFVTALTRQAGETALKYFGRADSRLKPDRTWVTEADLAVEELILKVLAREFPGHSVLGEESSDESTPSGGNPHPEFIWAVDPIDGTDSYRAGFPVWAVSIGLLERGDPVLGVIRLPLLDETYAGSDGNGASLNGRPIAVNREEKIDDLSLLLVPSDYHRRFRSDFPGKVRAMGSAAANVAYVARGSADACLTEAYIWDLAGGMAIAKAAGAAWRHLDGTAVDLGRHLNREKIQPPVIISNPKQLEYWLKAVDEI